MPPFGFNAPITEGFVAFAIPTLDKQSFHIQRSELTSSMDYKHTKTQQLTNAPTHQLKISSTHQLKNINPQTQKLKLLFFILQQHSNFRCILAKKRVKK